MKNKIDKLVSMHGKVFNKLNYGKNKDLFPAVSNFLSVLFSLYLHGIKFSNKLNM